MRIEVWAPGPGLAQHLHPLLHHLFVSAIGGFEVVFFDLAATGATWRGEHPDTAHLVTGDVVAAVRALKDRPGDELQIWGSGSLLETLLQHELVDRFRLMTFPVLLGSGRRLFRDGALPTTMRAVDLTVTELGVVIATYEPAGPARHGQM